MIDLRNKVASWTHLVSSRDFRFMQRLIMTAKKLLRIELPSCPVANSVLIDSQASMHAVKRHDQSGPNSKLPLHTDQTQHLTVNVHK